MFKKAVDRRRVFVGSLAALVAVLVVPNVSNAQADSGQPEKASTVAAGAVTQREFALRLARALDMKGVDDGDRAVESLDRVGIRPLLAAPGGKWQPAAVATERFVAAIQASVQSLLKRVAVDLGVPAPPTLELFVFEVPFAAQSITYPSDADVSTDATGTIPPTSAPPALEHPSSEVQ